MADSVLYFSSHLRGLGGSAGMRSWHQVRVLAERFQVSVVIPGIDPVSGQRVTPEQYSGLDFSRVTVKHAWMAHLDRRAGVLSRALTELSCMAGQLWQGLTSRKPNMVLCMSVPVTQLAVAVLMSYLRRVPLIVDVRDMPFQTAAEVGYVKSPRITSFCAGVEVGLLRRAHSILTNSPRYKDLLVAENIPEERIEVAPIGYDDLEDPSIDLIHSWRTRLEEALGLSSGAFLCVYAGTLGLVFPAEKFLDVANDLRAMDDLGFVFVGDGQRLSPMKARVAAEGLPAVFTGRVSKADVHAILRCVDVCLYPATSAGPYSAAILGNKVFDYLGAGKPILYVGSEGAVSDIIQELNAGIVCAAEDTSGAAKALVSLKEDDALRHRLETGGSRFRAAGYTARQSAEVLRDMIAGIVSPSREVDDVRH